MDDATTIGLVFMAIITIGGAAVGLVSALHTYVAKPINNLNEIISTLVYRVDNVEKDVDELEKNKKVSHEKIHARIDKVEDDVNDLDKRVGYLEKG